MQALYQAELAGLEVEIALQNIFESEKFIPETLDFARFLARENWGAR